METIHIKRGFVESEVDAKRSTARFCQPNRSQEEKEQKKSGLPHRKKKKSAIEEIQNLGSRIEASTDLSTSPTTLFTRPTRQSTHLKPPASSTMMSRMPFVLLVHGHILPLRLDHRLEHRLVLDVRILGRGRRRLRRSD